MMITIIAKTFRAIYKQNRYIQCIYNFFFISWFSKFIDEYLLFQLYQGTLDRWTPHTKSRWVGSAVLLTAFILRIITKQVYWFDKSHKRSFLIIKWKSVKQKFLFILKCVNSQNYHIKCNMFIVGRLTGTWYKKVIMSFWTFTILIAMPLCL